MEPNSPKNTQSEQTRSVSSWIAEIISTFKGKRFIAADIIDKLHEHKVKFTRSSVDSYLYQLRKKNKIKVVGKNGRSPVHIETGVETPVDDAETHTDMNPVPIAEAARKIIQGFNGTEFEFSDVLDDLEDEGIRVSASTVRSFLAMEKKAGRILVPGTDGLRNIYRQNPEQVRAPDPPQETVNYSAVFFAVVAGLQKFSMNYLSTEIASIGPWNQEEAEYKARSVIARLRKSGHLVATMTRPAVYKLMPQFYLDNLSNMPAYCETAPHLEGRIMRTFGEHCGPAAEPGKTPIAFDPKTEERPAPSGAVGQIAAKLDEIIKQAAEAKAEARLQELRYKLEDKSQSLINHGNRVRDLESQNRKLTVRIDRLSSIIEEKNRVNAVLQKRLNDTLHGRKRHPGQKSEGSFALADLLHVGGKSPLVIDGSPSAKDIPTSNGEGGL